MKIGIDARVLTAKPAGIGNYLISTLKKLLSIDRSNQYILFSNKEIFLPFESDNLEKIVLPSKLNVPGTLWLHTKSYRAVRRRGIDIYWGPCNVLPFILPGKFNVVTMHDLVWHYYPETMEWSNRIIGKLLCKSSIEKADAVFAVSKTTIKDLSANFQPKDVILTYNGISDDYLNYSKNSDHELEVKKKYGISNNFLLVVSTIEPRKNFPTLIKGFIEHIKGDNSHKDLQLVVVGSLGWGDLSFISDSNNREYKERIRFIGYVPQKDMPALYSAAKAFISASIYEGFGLPLLESMAVGTPVLCSDIPVYREVAGDSCVNFSPKNKASIANSIKSIITNEDLRLKLINCGLTRIQDFSWEKSAKIILNTFENFKRRR